MYWRWARIAVLLALGAAPGAAARAERAAQLRVDAPAPDAPPVSEAWVEVRGQAAARELARHDLVLVLDLSDSSLLPSGWDVDGDGQRGTTDAALLARLAANPTTPPGLVARLRESDFDDSVLAAELAAARALIARLESPGREAGGTRVGIVVFSNGARVVAPLGASRAALETALTELEESFARELGGTSFGDAVGAAQLVLQPESGDRPSAPPAGRDQSILLLSDGSPTLPPHGDRARQYALYASAAAAGAGIRIFPFELTRDPAKRSVLAEMAERSSGRLERLERPGDAIARLRRTDLAGLAELRVANETTGDAARALRTFPDGSFDAFVPLAAGRNRISIRVRTTDGARAEQERVVIRAGPSQPTGERALLDELRERTRETELWTEMERSRRAIRREIEVRVEPAPATR